MTIRVGVGAANLNGSVPSGLNRYTGELVRAMLADTTDVTVYTSAVGELPAGNRDRVRGISSSRVQSNDFKGNLARLLWHQLELPRLLKADGVNVFHSPVPEGMFFPVCPQVVTVHDLIPLRFPASNPRLRHYYRWVLPRILRASSAIVAVSEATRQDMVREWDLRGIPVHVIYQGYREQIFKPSPEPEVSAVKSRYGLGDFVLAVGDPRAHKNLARVISAFASLRQPDLQLVIVGRMESAELVRSIQDSGCAERIRLAGSIADEDLAALYSGACALVFPSLWEGFGIPPLEAMACGCPVITSKLSSMPEVCGDAAVYVDPMSIDSIARGISALVSEPEMRRTLRVQGMERARRFSYASTARKTLELLQNPLLASSAASAEAIGS